METLLHILLNAVLVVTSTTLLVFYFWCILRLKIKLEVIELDLKEIQNSIKDVHDEVRIAKGSADRMVDILSAMNSDLRGER